MVAGCGSKIAKFILFFVNFCVWVVSVILIGVGVYVMVKAGEYSYLFGDENSLSTVAGFVIGVGVIIFIVAFCGCCGAIKENTCLLKIYFALILLVLILEIVAAIMAFVFKDQVKDVLTEQIQKIIEDEYNGEEKNVPTETIDKLQMQFMCCGGNGTADWAVNAAMAANMTAVPVSCCKDENEAGCNDGAPGWPSNPDAVYQEGCVEAFEDYIIGNYLIVGGVCLGLLIFEILALIFTCCLIKAKADEDKQL